ncbi:MAG TPA: hypothetical protein VIG24_16315 [Acidimicrobiia bacterium]
MKDPTYYEAQVYGAELQFLRTRRDSEDGLRAADLVTLVPTEKLIRLLELSIAALSSQYLLNISEPRL